MKNSMRDNSDIRERVKRGLDLTFEKLLKEKIRSDGIFVISQNGVIKKVRAAEMRQIDGGRRKA